MSNENLNELWSRAKELLKEETTVITYQTWIQPLELRSVRDNVIVLVASNSFQKDTIESRYLTLLVNTFNFITNKKCNVIIKLKDEEDINIPTASNITNNKMFINSGLNPKYTFDTFVVGSNNKFAQAAAQGVSDNPRCKI